MRSGFGFRRHPILGYSKMHTGVDWSAPYGTPIFASGNGTVDKVGWEGGYGKYVRVKHNNGYETAYGHMSAFARGIEPGKRIRQGQVIGFVGSTGLSTGAHVHYEIVVNGRFVDPMRIRLPRGRVLEGPMLAGFEKERDRVEGMMSRKAGAPARAAQAQRQLEPAAKRHASCDLQPLALSSAWQRRRHEQLAGNDRHRRNSSQPMALIRHRCASPSWRSTLKIRADHARVRDDRDALDVDCVVTHSCWMRCTLDGATFRCSLIGSGIRFQSLRCRRYGMSLSAIRLVRHVVRGSTCCSALRP